MTFLSVEFLGTPVGRSVGSECESRAKTSGRNREASAAPRVEPERPLASETVAEAVEQAEETALDDRRRLGRPIRAGNLTVWPVIASTYEEVGEFLTLWEAQEQGLVSVREEELGGPQRFFFGLTGRTAIVENRGDLPILVCAGTILKGGYQDRTVAQDLVVGAREMVRVPVFCVEPRRWGSIQCGTDTRGMFQALDFIAAGDIRFRAQYRADQRRVWLAVHGYNAASGGIPETATFPPTVGALDGEAARTRAAFEGIVLRHFARLRENGRAPIVGFAYAVNGEPVSVRAFAHPRLLEKHLPAFAKTMAIEAEVAQTMARIRGKPPCNRFALADRVVWFVHAVSRGEPKTQWSTPSTYNVIRQNAAGGSSACWWIATGTEECRGQGDPAAQGILLTEDWTRG